ncbi:hypothetical protein HPB50_011871 [Hyalomma asiaticum]|uniref:Uncharacterized protein n=1 Tax=Hyalomma asiaticum TaxID=266040 RepID=A0ACB7SPY4_HYAAI|nr:hypothetical protein HPB50_011871 [Hyalomma asiaticum]
MSGKKRNLTPEEALDLYSSLPDLESASEDDSEEEYCEELPCDLQSENDSKSDEVELAVPTVKRKKKPPIGRNPRWLSGGRRDNLHSLASYVRGEDIRRKITAARLKVRDSSIAPDGHPSKLWCERDTGHRSGSKEKMKLVHNLASHGGIATVAADSHANFLGYSAKYGVYSLLETKSNEVASSGHMELEGLKRALTALEESDVPITEVVTDQCAQVRRKEKPDAWYICEGLNKKITQATKSTGCQAIGL